MSISAPHSEPRQGMSVAEHTLRCRCGTLSGMVVNPRGANRVVCYCGTCQAFAHFLGDKEHILDPQGGSNVIQVLPKNVTFTQGLDALTCLRLTPKGLLRWYARCCRTPIGNTLATPKWSFIGLLHNCLESGERPLDNAFGPVTSWLNTGGAKVNPKPKERGLGKTVGWFLRTTLKARFNGDYVRTPLFHRDTGAPIVTPYVLSSDELARVMAAVRA